MSGLEHQFLVNSECVCLDTEEMKEELERTLKAESCAMKVSVREESKAEINDEGNNSVHASMIYQIWPYRCITQSKLGSRVHV